MRRMNRGPAPENKAQGGAVNKGLMALIMVLLAGAAVAVVLILNQGQDAGEKADAVLTDMPLMNLESRGKAVEDDGVITVENVVLTPRQGQEEIRVAVGAVRVVEAQGGNGTLLAESMTFTDVNIQGPGATFTIGEFTLVRPRGGRLGFDAATTPEQVFSKETALKLLTEFELDEATLKNIKATFPYGGISLDRVSFYGHTRGRLERYLIEGFHMTGSGTMVKVDSYEGRGMIYGDVMERFIRDGELPLDANDKVTAEYFCMKGMEMTTPDQESITLSELSMTDMERSGTIPTSMKLAVKGFSISTAKLRGTFLGDMMKDDPTFTLDLELDYSFDIQKGSLDLRALRLGSESLGSIFFALSVDGLQLENVGDLESEKAWRDMRLILFKLRYEDNSLAERALDAMAKERFTEPEDLRRELEALLDNATEKAGNSTFAKDTAQDLKQFIEKPTSFSISMEPKTPVSLRELSASLIIYPQDVWDMLNIKIEWGE